MAKSPAYPMYAQDFDMDTKDWTSLEVGIYVRLLNYEWINEGLPCDESRLARIGQVDKRTFRACWADLLNKKFTMSETNMYVNRRMEDERQKQHNYQELQRIKGIKSGEKRKKKVNRGSTGVQPKGQPKGNLSFSSSFSFSSSIKNLLPEDIKEIIKESAWNGFITMREKIKKPLTERAVELIGKELSKLMKQGNDVNAVLDQSTVNNYQDVYALKNKGGSNGNGSGHSGTSTVKSFTKTKGTGYTGNEDTSITGSNYPCDGIFTE